MSRTLLATLIVTALVLNAWSAAAGTGMVPAEAVGTVAAANNPSVLPPGGAAGIKQAQGIDFYWREAGLVIAAFVIVFVVMGIDDNNHDETTTTTGTSLH